MKHRRFVPCPSSKALAALALGLMCGVAQARSVSVTVGGPKGEYYVILYKWENNRQIAVGSIRAPLTGKSLTSLAREFKFDNLSEGVYCANVMRCDTGDWRFTQSLYARMSYGNYKLDSVTFPIG